MDIVHYHVHEEQDVHGDFDPESGGELLREGHFPRRFVNNLHQNIQPEEREADSLNSDHRGWRGGIHIQPVRRLSYDQVHI